MLLENSSHPSVGTTAAQNAATMSSAVTNERAG